MPDDALIECVPNVSEGRDPVVIAALAAAVRAVTGVRLLHVDSSVDAHRTVLTFAGPTERVGDAAIALAHAVAGRVDMRRQRGAHPRIGALDVCPFVPVRGATLDRCARLARRVGATIAHDLRMPVFLYEAAAFDPVRAALPVLRRGEFEGLPQKLQNPAFVPDFGPTVAHPTMGAAIVGARSFWSRGTCRSTRRTWPWPGRSPLASVRLARRGQKAETRVHRPGLLPAVRAVGWAMPAYGHAQVSLNLLDFTVTPMHVAWRVVGEEAAAHGVHVIGSELVGLVPIEALRAAGRDALGDAHRDVSDATLVEAAVAALRLDAIHPFDPRERVLEWAIEDGRAPL